MVILVKGKGSAKTFDKESESVVLVAIGEVLASSVDGRNLSGSKEGCQGYSLQSPKTLKAICSVSLSIKRTC
jgi:hypothetical protein